jgi:hypothetical protein
MRHYLSVVLVGPLLVAGCGSDDKHGGLPDAPPLTPDAPAPVVGPVTLTVTHNGSAIPGVHAYFLNADSSVIAVRDTDASGVATADMTAGGSVTAIDPFAPLPAATVTVGDNDLRTFMGVKPGDHLVLTQNDARPVPITFTLNAKAFMTTDITANAYDVRTSCGAASIPSGGSGGSGSPDPGGEITLSDCHDKADILIIAKNQGEGTQVLGALYHAGVGLTPDGIVNLDDAYAPIADVTFQYMHVPVDFSFAVEHALGTARGAFADLSFFGSSGPDETGAVTFSLQEPTITDATSIVDTSLSRNGSHHVIERAATAAYTLDMAGVLLPDLHNQPFYKPAAQKMEWVEEATGARPDLTMTSIEVSRTDGSQNVRHWHWAVAAPYNPAAELTFPTLPTDVADWTPSASDQINVNTLLNAQVPGGYDAVRAHVYDVSDARGFGGASGRVVTVETRSGVRGGLGTPRSRTLRAGSP